MPRIAGDDPGYTFRLCRTAGGLAIKPTKYGFTMPSVSTFIGEVMGKPASAMAWWGYRIAFGGIAQAVEEDPDKVLEVMDDADLLEALLKERGVNPNMKLETAGSRGSAAHEILEMLSTNKPEDLKLAIAAAKKENREFQTHYGDAVLSWWHEQVKPHLEDGSLKQVLSEQPVWSRSLWYAGTFDLAFEWENGWEILDGKTHKPASGFTKPGKGPGYIGDATQIRAYRMAFEEMGMGQTIGQRTVVFRENGAYLEDAREVPENFVRFLREAYDVKLEFEKGEETA